MPFQSRSSTGAGMKVGVPPPQWICTTLRPGFMRAAMASISLKDVVHVDVAQGPVLGEGDVAAAEVADRLAEGQVEVEGQRRRLGTALVSSMTSP